MRPLDPTIALPATRRINVVFSNYITMLKLDKDPAKYMDLS